MGRIEKKNQSGNLFPTPVQSFLLNIKKIKVILKGQEFKNLNNNHFKVFMGRKEDTSTVVVQM